MNRYRITMIVEQDGETEEEARLAVFRWLDSTADLEHLAASAEVRKLHPSTSRVATEPTPAMRCPVCVPGRSVKPVGAKALQWVQCRTCGRTFTRKQAEHAAHVQASKR